MTRTFRKLVGIYFVVFLVGLVMVAFVATTESPENSPLYVYVILYGGVFLGVIGLGGLAGVTLRYWFGSQVEVFTKQKTTVRQSIFLGMLGVSALYLQSLRLLNIYTMGLLVVFFFIIELIFLNKTKPKNL